MSLPLITLVNNRFEFNHQARDHLLGFESDTPVGVLSIIGKYRTGKSFFLNNVIFNSSEELFRVGPTINPCTKGIWVAKQLLTPNSSMKVIVLDVEGFGIIDEQDSSDGRIFLFPLLLSSYLLYNSVGNITEEAIRILGIIVALARQVQLKSHRNEACSYFPAFHWILRDFTLQLEDANGNQISSREYLEKALDSQKGISEAIEQKNRTRRNFRQFFVERDCTTLLRPTHSDQDTDTAREFRPEFLEEARITREKIISSIRPKCFNGANLTIRTFVDLTETLVEILNSGNIPSVESAWSAIYTGRERSIIFQISDQLTKLYEQGTILSSSTESEIERQVERYFNSEFQRLSMSPEHPSDEVMKLLRSTITATAQTIISRLNERQACEAKEQLIGIYKQLESRCDSLSDIETLKGQLSQIKLDNLELFGRLPVGRQYELESEVKMRCFQILSVKMEISLAVLEDQVQLLSNQVSVKSEAIAQRDRTIELLEEQVQSKTDSAKNWEQQVEQLQHSLTKLGQQNEHLQLRARSNESLIISLEGELRSSKDKQYDEMLERMKVLDQEIDRLQAALKEATERNDWLQATKTQVVQNMNRLQSDYHQLKRKNQFQADELTKLSITLEKLVTEAAHRQSKINQTEVRIYQQIEAEELRIQSALKAGELREKQKDLIIEKLERILRQATSRRTDPTDHTLLSKLKQELEHTRTENELLNSQLCSLSKELQQRSAQLEHLKLSNFSTSENVKSSLMNVGLTNKGFEIKSFVSPSNLKHSKSGGKVKNPFQRIEKVCIDTQLQLQAQTNHESQLLIEALLKRQQSLRREIQTLRQSTTNRQETSNPQIWLHPNNESSLTLSVPAYFVTESPNGRTSTDYQIVLKLGDGQQWTVRRRFKDVCDLRKALMECSNQLQPPNLYRSTRLEEKRKSIEDFLKVCLTAQEYRNSLELKRFLCDVEYHREDVSERLGSPASHLLDNTLEAPKNTSSSVKSPLVPLQQAPQRKQPLQPRYLNSRC